MSRGSGFVQFMIYSVTGEVMSNYFSVIIQGKWVECKKALPKEACSELLRGAHGHHNGHNSARNGGCG